MDWRSSTRSAVSNALESSRRRIFAKARATHDELLVNGVARERT
jgi:hypothetical protein